MECLCCYVDKEGKPIGRIMTVQFTDVAEAASDSAFAADLLKVLNSEGVAILEGEGQRFEIRKEGCLADAKVFFLATMN